MCLKSPQKSCRRASLLPHWGCDTSMIKPCTGPLWLPEKLGQEPACGLSSRAGMGVPSPGPGSG